MVKGIVKDITLTGIVDIDLQQTAKQWNHLFYLAEWRGENHSKWTLIKYIRKDSQATDIKIQISEANAQQLISKLDLQADNVVFKSAWSWRRIKDEEQLNQWRIAKFKSKTK